MAINNSTKFSPVYTTPSYLAKQLAGDASKLQEGKLYFATGEASGMIGQGLYVYTADNNESNDGKGTISLFGSGTIASATTPGLLDPSTFTYITKLKDGSIKAPNATHADNASTADKVANTLDISIAGANRLTYDGSTNKTIVFVGSGDTSVKQSVSNNILTVTIDSTDTTYSAEKGITLSNGMFGHTNFIDASDNSTGNQTLAWGSSVNIPYVKYDAYGHITDKGTTTLTMPSNPNTDKSVTTSATTSKIYLIGKIDASKDINSTARYDACVYAQNGKVYATSGSINSTETALVTGAAVNSAISTALTSLFKYQGDVTATPTSSTVGYAYRASKSFILATTNSATNSAQTLEIGDILLCTTASTTSPKFTVIQNNITNAATFDPSNNTSGQIAVFGSNGQIKTTGTSISDITTAISEVAEAATAAAGTVKDTSGTGKSYLLGHASQGSTAAATTNASVYIDGSYLYSGGKKVLVAGDANNYTHPVSTSGTTLADSSLKSSTATSVSHGGTFTVATGVYRDTSGHISKVATETIKLPSQYSHPAATSGTTAADGSKDTSVLKPSHGGTFTVVTGAYRDASGHISKVKTQDVTLPAQYSHPSLGTTSTTVDSSAKTASTLTHGGTFTVVTGALRDSSGHIGKVVTQQLTLPTVDTAVYWEVLS